MPKADRHALAARDVGIRKPLSPGWHAELHAPFELHAVYREHGDGTRQTYGSLSVEAVEAWQRAVKSKGRRSPVQTARVVMDALAEAMEREFRWTEMEAKHPARFKAVQDAVRAALATPAAEACSPGRRPGAGATEGRK